MNAAWMRARSDLTSGWRSWVVLAIITGLFGGIVTAAAAGARRTDSAYPRFLEVHKPFDQLVFVSGFPGAEPIDPRRIGSLPEVGTWAEGVFFNDTDERFDITGSTDERVYTTLNSPTILEGRLPDPDAVDEAYAPRELALKAGLELEEEVTLDLLAGSYERPVRVPVTLRIVGIGLAPSEFPPESDLGPGWVHVTAAFTRRYLAREPAPLTAHYVLAWLDGGESSLGSFQEGLDVIGGGSPLVGFQQAALTKNIRRAFRTQAVALGLLAALLALAALALAGQTIARATWLAARDNAAMSAIGMTRRQLFATAMLRVLVVGVVASALACALALALSPLAPSGLARIAEPDPGFAVDGIAMGAGAGGTLVLAQLLGILPAWRASRAVTTAEPTPRSAIAEAAARGGAPVTTTLGMRFAFERGAGRTATPTRATIVGLALAVGAISAAFTFGGSLQHLLQTPRLYGTTWDVNAGAFDEEIPIGRAERIAATLERDPDVRAAAPALLGIPVRIGDVLADGMAMDDSRPSLLPPLLEGRYPSAADEIVLGRNTLRRLGARVGDRIDAHMTGLEPEPYRIVGVGVIPTVGHTANLGEGSLVTPEGLGRLLHGALGVGVTVNEMIFSVRPGADVTAVTERIRGVTGNVFPEIYPPLQPGDLLNFGRQRNLPFVLAGILGALAALTLAHALVTSIVRRRRDLAILKASGMRPLQVRASVAWHATALAAVGILIGLPAGTAAGRWLWTTYAIRLGILPEPRPPWVLLLLTIPAVLLLANAIAFEPGRRAARIPSAVVLRAE